LLGIKADQTIWDKWQNPVNQLVTDEKLQGVASGNPGYRCPRIKLLETGQDRGCSENITQSVELDYSYLLISFFIMATALAFDPLTLVKSAGNISSVITAISVYLLYNLHVSRVSTG